MPALFFYAIAIPVIFSQNHLPGAMHDCRGVDACAIALPGRVPCIKHGSSAWLFGFLRLLSLRADYPALRHLHPRVPHRRAWSGAECICRNQRVLTLRMFSAAGGVPVCACTLTQCRKNAAS